MKHFANFNNIGLGIGAAVGLVRGSGLIGESQEERDNTTGLGRLGKLAGYTGGGAALGAGTGMAVSAGTKYLQGRKGAVPEPRPQDRTTSAEPWDDDWTKPQSRRPEPVTLPPLSRPTGYRGLSKEDAAEKLRKRKQMWEQDAAWNYPNNAYQKAAKDSSISDKDFNKIRGVLQKETAYKTLVGLQDDIQSGYYSKSQTNSRNF
jgi:hypothetical protein